MDALLSKVTQQAMNYAIRSGIVITSTYAIRQCNRLVKTTPRGSEREELLNLQIRLESKIRIISPAIDMIELIAARGNTTLESAVTLTKDLRWEIQTLGVQLANAANEEELLRRKSSRAKSRQQNELELKLIISNVKKLLARIEDAVPLINLAITTSGVNLSTNLPATVSPSRLLQASTFLTAADSQYTAAPGQSVQVGPSYLLSVYMLFASHTNRPHDEESARETTWKEVIHKARLKLVRVPLHSLYHLPGDLVTPSGARYFPKDIPSESALVEYAYQLVLVEDLDDDRVHTFDENEPQPGPFEDVPLAGIRDVVPIHEISKIFYADTGKILNIGSEGETNSPILLLKRDVHAEPPRRMMERRQSEDPNDQNLDDNDDDDDDDKRSTTTTSSTNSELDEQSMLDAQILRESTPVQRIEAEKEHATTKIDADAHWRLPPDLDPEWIAFEVYTEEPDSEDDEDDDDSEPPVSEPEATPSRSSIPRESSLDPDMTANFSNLNLQPPSPAPTPHTLSPQNPQNMTATPIKTSLSLLEMLIRLTALQQFRQSSHLTIEDELLNFFLEDSATTGAGANAEYRQRVRRDARRRVGFDPYDESPIKRRGEEYLAHPRSAAENWQGSGDDDNNTPGSERYYGYASPEQVRTSVESPGYFSRQASPGVPSSPSPLLRNGGGVSRSPLVQTTPSSKKGRSATLRKGDRHHHHHQRVASPLARGSTTPSGDSTLGASPSSAGTKQDGQGGEQEVQEE